MKGKQKEQNRESKNVNLLSREINFKKFNNTKFHNEKYIIRRMLINPWHLSKYDYFVTGSDQVWNPVYKLVKYVMYLRFALKRKRIAVAASFGMSDILEECQEIVARYLKGMHYISVRENSGKKIVEKYTNHSCDVFPDPTVFCKLVLQKRGLQKQPYLARCRERSESCWLSPNPCVSHASIYAYTITATNSTTSSVLLAIPWPVPAGQMVTSPAVTLRISPASLYSAVPFKM